MGRAIGTLVGSLAMVMACSGGDAESAAPAPAPSASASATDGGATSTSHSAPSALRRCAVGRQEPTSITDAVTRWSALAPADGPCIVAALPRPLAVVATRGAVSAQPADGPRSPRLFFLLPKLVVSAVPSGMGSKVIEFGEWVSPTRTIKGELALPVIAGTAPDAPFARVLGKEGDGSICRTCHREEQRASGITNAFTSLAFQPEPSQVVTVAELAKLHDTCARENDTSDRCAMFHALFDFGPVEQGAFDADVPAFNLP